MQSGLMVPDSLDFVTITIFFSVHDVTKPQVWKMHYKTYTQWQQTLYTKPESYA